MSVESAGLTIRSVACRGVSVPLRFKLGTSAAVVSSVPILLIDLAPEEGPTGRTYLFCYTPSGARAVTGHLTEAVSLAVGQRASPFDIAAMLSRRFALLGVTGTVRMALSALDLALWDALGQALRLPVCSLLGSSPRGIPAYDSRGLGLMPPEALAGETEALLARGLRAIKLRLGYPSLAADIAAVRAVRKRLPDGVDLMVDYNQALTTTEAVLRGRALDGEGLCWLEEPIRHDDWGGNARVAREVAIPLQIGENFNGPEGMAEALARQACHLVMPDVARIGGATGWMQAASLAHAHGVRMSSHLMPEASAHLLAATPTAHWLEWVDWAEAFLAEPFEIADGRVLIPDRPGFGMDWDEAKVARLATI
ncbi:enolase C-terminal domain-like protein [Nostoc sp. NIES-2111]